MRQVYGIHIGHIVVQNGVKLKNKSKVSETGQKKWQQQFS